MLSGHGKMIDPCGQLLHHERPFTLEGNYLVVHCYLSLVMVTSGIVSCAFLFVCPLYCFQLEHCLIVYFLCMFCCVCIFFHTALECLLQDLSFCICLTDPRDIAQL